MWFPRRHSPVPFVQHHTLTKFECVKVLRRLVEGRIDLSHMFILLQIALPPSHCQDFGEWHRFVLSTGHICLSLMSLCVSFSSSLGVFLRSAWLLRHYNFLIRNIGNTGLALLESILFFCSPVFCKYYRWCPHRILSLVMCKAFFLVSWVQRTRQTSEPLFFLHDGMIFPSFKCSNGPPRKGKCQRKPAKKVFHWRYYGQTKNSWASCAKESYMTINQIRQWPSVFLWKVI